MPSTATITAFYDFVPLTTIRSAQVDNNFSVFRGHIIPVETATATAAHLTYDLGSAGYAWRGLYNQYAVMYQNTTGSVPASPSSGFMAMYFKNDGLLYSKNPSGTEVAIGGSAATGLAEYADDAAFVTANGAAEDGDIYYNTTTDKIRAYANGAWTNILASDIVTAKGDIVVATASNAIARQGIGTDGHVLTADSAQTNGLKWAAVASAPSASYELSNLSLACSVAANALTIALKDASGSDPSAGSPVKIGFRNATAGTGTYSQVSVTGALSTVISSGSTAGHTSGKGDYIYVYAINNAGTAELAWSTYRYKEGSVVSTTAEGGAGAADSRTAIYSTTARAGVALRLIGRLKSNQATAGTWASVPTEISLIPFNVGTIAARYTTTAGQTIGTGGSPTIVDFGTVAHDYGPSTRVTTGASWKFTADEPGMYSVKAALSFGSATGLGSTESWYIYLYKNGSVYSILYRAIGAGVSFIHGNGDDDVPLLDGDYIDIRVYQESGGNLSLATDAGVNFVCVSRTGDY